MDSVNSTTFIKKPPYMTETQESLLYSKELLSGRLFLGCYEERRYVSILNDYRDLVIISSEETDLHQDLDKVRKKLLSVVGVKWVGITGPEIVGMPKAYCFWVKFTNLPFGHYWFQIKHVKLVEGEVLLYLKYIRKSLTPAFVADSHAPVQHQTKPAITKTKNKNTITGEFSSQDIENWDFDFKGAFVTFFRAFKEPIEVIQPHITWGNLIAAIRLICALTIAVVMGIISIVGHLGEYVLKLIRELSILVNAFTPIIIQIIDFFTKAVGGFYILLAGMFSRNGPPPAFPNYRQNKIFYVPQSVLLKKPNHTSPPIDWKERNKLLRLEFLSNSKH